MNQLVQESFGAIEDDEDLETDSPIIKNYQTRDDTDGLEIEPDHTEIENLISRYEVVEDENEIGDQEDTEQGEGPSEFDEPLDL